VSEKSKHAKGSFLMLYLTRAGHGLDPSMDWIGLGCIKWWDDCGPYLYSIRCSTVDAVSFK